MSWHDWADDEAEASARRRAVARRRATSTRRAPTARSTPSTTARLVSFASNDYLGLTHHPAVRRRRARRHRPVGHRGRRGAPHRRLAPGAPRARGRRSPTGSAPRRAVLFTTGFAANLGVLTTFAGPDALVCSDELNHASLIDGRRLAGAPLAVYRHRDAAHVDELLRAPHRAARASSSSETVFSMDGDVAPVDKLARRVRAPRRAARARRGPRGARPARSTRAATTSTCCGSARCRRPSARSAGSSPARSATPTCS